MGSTLTTLFRELIKAGLYNQLWADTSISVDGTYLIVIGATPEVGLKIIDSSSGERIEECKSFEVKLDTEYNGIGMTGKGVDDDAAEIVLGDVLELITRKGTRQFSSYDIPFELPAVEKSFQFPFGKTLDVFFKARSVAEFKL